MRAANATENAARLRDVSELDFTEQDGMLVADLAIPGCHARIIKLTAGSAIPLHRHTRRSVKVLLTGAITLAGEDGPLGNATPATLYECDGVIYRGDVLADSYLLAIDEEGSERVNVDQRTAASA